MPRILKRAFQLFISCKPPAIASYDVQCVYVQLCNSWNHISLQSQVYVQLCNSWNHISLQHKFNVKLCISWNCISFQAQVYCEFTHIMSSRHIAVLWYRVLYCDEERPHVHVWLHGAWAWAITAGVKNSLCWRLTIHRTHTLTFSHSIILRFESHLALFHEAIWSPRVSQTMCVRRTCSHRNHES